MTYATLDRFKGKPPRFLRETTPSIPYSNLSLCAGVEGTGKSTFICGLVVDLLHHELRRNTKQIHLCLAEDDIHVTTLPRLRAAGATPKDLARIIVKDGRPWSFPEDLGQFAELLANHNVGLVVLDPVDNIVDGISTAKGKRSLDRLDYFAKLTGCAILLVGHVNKGDHKNIRSALGGARRLLAVSRSTWVWGQEPESGAQRGPVEFRDLTGPTNSCSVLACVKNSLGPMWEPALFENCPVPNPADPKRQLIVHRRVELTTPLGYTPLGVVNGVGLPAGPPPASKRDQAKRLILKFLYVADADRGLSGAELAEAVIAGGISQETFERARSELAKEDAIERFQEKGIDGRTIAHRWRLAKLQVPAAPE